MVPEHDKGGASKETGKDGRVVPVNEKRRPDATSEKGSHDAAAAPTDTAPQGSSEVSISTHRISFSDNSPEKKEAGHDAPPYSSPLGKGPPAGEGVEVPNAARRNDFLSRFLRRIWSPPAVPTKRVPSGQYGAGIFSRIFFTWPTHVIWAAFSRGLDILDIEEIDPRRRVSVKIEIFQARFDELMARKARFALVRAIFTAYRRPIVIVLINSLIYNYTLLYGGLVYWAFGKYLDNAYYRRGGDDSVGLGIGFAFASAAQAYFGLVAWNHALYQSALVGGEIRTMLGTLMYAKSFRISPTALRPRQRTVKESKSDYKDSELAELLSIGHQQEDEQDSTYWTQGAVISSMSVDTKRIEDAIGVLPYTWPMLPTLPGMYGASYIMLGWPGILGAGIMTMCFPVIAWLGNVVSNRRNNINKLMELRTNLVMDMLRGVRFLKIFAWEDVFLNRLNRVRKGEAERLMGIQISTVSGWLITFAMQRMPALVATYVFSRFFNINHSSYSVITYLYAIYMYGENLVMLMLHTPTTVLAIPSIRNIQHYLSAEERDAAVYIKSDPDAPYAVDFDRAEFSWHSDAVRATLRAEDHLAQFRLSEITLQIKRDELVAVVGPVGSGKSSLAGALVGHLVHRAGSLTLGVPPDKVSYCPQTAWIQNSSVRDNIVFGLPFDQARYDAVLDASALRRDVEEEFPHADATELGERGINISGGQKARIQLARALYRGMGGGGGGKLASDCKIFVLDDPLSAVDAHTSKIIFQRAIKDGLAGRCRILITHQLQYIKQCDRVVWLGDGRVRGVGHFDDLVRELPAFVRFVDTCSQEAELEYDIRPSSGAVDAAAGATGEKEKRRRGPKDAHALAAMQSDRLIEEEGRAIKPVPLSLYKTYLGLGVGWTVFWLLIASCVFSQSVNMIFDLAIAWWADAVWGLPDYGYVCMALGVILVHGITWGAFYVGINDVYINSSRILMKKAMEAVFRAPQSFFDTTPMGRILNRFTNDINFLDTTLPLTYWWIGLGSLFFVAMVIVVIFYVYLAAAIFVPWAVVFLILIYFYRESPLELRRLESLRESLYVSHLEEGVSGRTMLVACGRQQDFLRELYDIVDDLNSLHFMGFSTFAWMNNLANLLSSVLILMVSIFIVLIRFSVSPGLTLLVLTVCPSIAGVVQYMLEYVTKMQRGMNAVERLNEYRVGLPDEGIRHVEGAVSAAWPPYGGIEIHDAHMRYRPELGLTLKGLTLSIRPGEKVGIVGRTGAGKSSLMAVLLRMVNLERGTIKIDGIDTAKIGLHDLRSRLAVIPQDPTLFLGTVRSNLDPEADRDDVAANARLEAALRAVSLFHDVPGEAAVLERVGSTISHAHRVTRLSLDSPVASEGTNFSTGNRQLMSLARALVRGSNIIVIDEATSNVDPRTDAKIQRAMRESFADATVLAIAHRIRTVLSYDKICLLDKGRVAEFAPPKELWERGGEFRGLCDAAGVEEREFHV